MINIECSTADNGFLFSNPSCQTMVLGGQVGVLGMYRCMSDLVQDNAQRFIAFPRFAGVPFPGAFMLPGATPAHAAK